MNKLNLRAGEPQHFNVAVPRNMKPTGTKIGKRLSFLFFFPVIRIPAEKHVRAGAVIRHVEGSENGHLFFLRMRGQNSDLIKEALEACYWRGKGDDHSVR